MPVPRKARIRGQLSFLYMMKPEGIAKKKLSEYSIPKQEEQEHKASLQKRIEAS